MRFAVGYPVVAGAEPFADVVADYRDQIAEVYFAWPGDPSGRPAGPAETPPEAMQDDLRELREMGVGLDVLFNANCYGAEAAGRALADRVISVLDRLDRLVGGADAATTTSPAVAWIVRKHFPRVEVRASVNMRIGTVQGMAYLADRFDGYYVQREHNRDLEQLARLRAWADAHGKRLHLLANSGCLAFCSGQTFHDNLVAHDREVDPAGALPGFDPHVCWGLLRNRANWPVVLQSTWIRPEDLHRYEGLFEEVKLATRVHARPRAVIDAYARGRHRGNLLDLLEPNFSRALAPYILDSERFPDDWFERTSGCGRQCDRCDYCAKTLDRLLVDARDAETAPL